MIIFAGMLKSLFKDLKSVHKKYESLGTSLHVPLEEIKAYEKMFKEDYERIFIEVINRWLWSHEEEDYAELFLNEKKEVDRICLTPVYHKKDYVRILCKALMDIGEEDLAEILKKKCEHQQSKKLQYNMYVRPVDRSLYLVFGFRKYRRKPRPLFS